MPRKTGLDGNIPPFPLLTPIYRVLVEEDGSATALITSSCRNVLRAATNSAGRST